MDTTHTCHLPLLAALISWQFPSLYSQDLSPCYYNTITD